MAYDKQTWTDGVTSVTAARLGHMETGIDEAHDLVVTAQTRADQAYELAQAGGGGEGGTFAPFVVYPGVPDNADGVDGQYALDGGSDNKGDIWLKVAGVWTPTGTNIRGAMGEAGVAGSNGNSWLPINFQIDGEVQPTTDALGMPAPFDLTVKKLILRLVKAPQTGNIVTALKADGATVTTVTVPIGQRMVKVDLDAFYPEDTVFTFEATSTGAPGGSGSGGAPSLSATSSFVRAKDSGSSTTATQFTIDIPTGTSEGDYLDTVIMSGKQVTTVPAGWTKVDEERDDAAFDVCWFTLLRKVASPSEGASQTVGFAAGCPYAAVTLRVPSSSQGRASTAPNSIGHGSTGTTEVNPTGSGSGASTVPTQGLTTTGPNRLGFFVAGARQTAGVATGIDSSLLAAQGLTVLASPKTATTGVNFSLVVATQVAASAGTLAAKTYKVVTGTGTNARWVTAQFAYLPDTGTTTAGETLAASLICLQSESTP